MNPHKLIEDTEEYAQEWLEMSTTPEYIVKWILANKVIKLQDHIDYLEKRLQHVSR